VSEEAAAHVPAGVPEEAEATMDSPEAATAAAPDADAPEPYTKAKVADPDADTPEPTDAPETEQEAPETGGWAPETEDAEVAQDSPEVANVAVPDEVAPETVASIPAEVAHEVKKRKMHEADDDDKTALTTNDSGDTLEEVFSAQL